MRVVTAKGIPTWANQQPPWPRGGPDETQNFTFTASSDTVWRNVASVRQPPFGSGKPSQIEKAGRGRRGEGGGGSETNDWGPRFPSNPAFV